MTNNDKALNVLVNKFKHLIEEHTSKLKFDKTFKSVVWGKNDNGTYQISYLGQKYNVPNALGTELQLGQSVWVKIPNGILRHMHICGLAFKK